MVRWAGGVGRTAVVRLVAGDVVFAVVDSVANLSHRDAAGVQTGELSVGARWVNAADLIGIVFAVVIVIALPRFEDAATVVAAEFVRRAGVVRAVVFVFVGVVSAVVVTVARPHAADAFAVAAEEFARIAGYVLGDAHSAFVD